MRSLKTPLFLIACSAILAACRTDFYVEAYVSDLFLSETLETPARMKLEIPACTSRAEYEPKILALFSSASNAKITDCVNEGMKSLLVASLTASVANKSSSADLTLFREPAKDEKVDGVTYTWIGVKPVINPSFILRVRMLMEENLQKLEYDNIKFEIELNNDTSGTVLYTTNYAWVDGQPFARRNKQPLKRRENAVFTFPNVTSDLVLQGQQPIVLWAAIPK